MSKTNSGLVEYAKAQVGLPYWFGTYGQTASQSLYNTMKNMYPDYYTADDFSSQYGQRVHDCSGLIKGYLWSDSPTGTPAYNAKQDLNAAGFYSTGSKKGAIATFPRTNGMLVFKGSTPAGINHVGVYADGYVYEAKGHNYGVKKTCFTTTGWTYWCQCSLITDDSSETSETVTEEVTADEVETATTTINGEVRATGIATSFDKIIAGLYGVTAKSGLNVRNAAGTSNNILVALPYGSYVRNYGYYTEVDGVKWLYIQFTYNGIKYTGFASSDYLIKT